MRPEVTHRGFSASPLRIQAQWAVSRPLPFVGQGGASLFRLGKTKGGPSSLGRLTRQAVRVLRRGGVGLEDQVASSPGRHRGR